MNKEEVKNALSSALDKAICDYGVQEYYNVDNTRDSNYLYLITDVKFKNYPSFRDLEDAYLVVCQAVEEIWGTDETPDAVNDIFTMIEDERLVFVFNLRDLSNA